MHEYLPSNPEISIVGALSLEKREGYIRPQRLPLSGLSQIPTAFMEAMVAATAGVRIRFSSEATEISLRLSAHPIQVLGPGPTRPATVDLMIDGSLVRSDSIAGAPALIDTESNTLTVGDSGPQEIRYRNLPRYDKLVELWLPHDAITDIIGIESDVPLRRAAPESRPKWIHHGSSISHCFEASHPLATWPSVAADKLQLDLLNLGYAGNAQLDPFVARAIRDAPADLITIKLGINIVNANSMSMRAFEPAVHGFIDTIREGHPTTPLVVISPIVCAAVEDTPGPTGLDAETGSFYTSATAPFSEDALTLTRIRGSLKRIVNGRSASDDNLVYLDGRSLFDQMDADLGLLPDGLHPNEAGYALMGERFANLLPGLVAAPLGASAFEDTQRRAG